MLWSSRMQNKLKQGWVPHIAPPSKSLPSPGGFFAWGASAIAGDVPKYSRLPAKTA